MKKYCLIALSIATSIQGMDHENQQLVWKDHKNKSFNPSDKALMHTIKNLPVENLTVLDYDCCPAIAQKLAKKAQLVHCDSMGCENDDLKKLKQDFSQTPNIVFIEPQDQIYDCATLYNPIFVTTKELWTSLTNISKLIKPSGTVFSLITTKENGLSAQETAFEELYPQIYSLMSEDKQKELGKKALPNRRNPKADLPDDELVKDFIRITDYEIITYQTKQYDVVIKNKNKHQESLAEYFDNRINNLNLEISEENAQPLKEQFVDLVCTILQHNQDGDLIYPFIATEIQLQKKQKSFESSSQNQKS